MNQSKRVRLMTLLRDHFSPSQVQEFIFELIELRDRAYLKSSGSHMDIIIDFLEMLERLEKLETLEDLMRKSHPDIFDLFKVLFVLANPLDGSLPPLDLAAEERAIRDCMRRGSRTCIEVRR